MSIVLEIENLTVKYGQALALENIGLRVDEKGLTAMIGPNGAGKTTLLRTISRLKDPAAGEISSRGVSLLQYGPNHLARLGIAHCPEGRKPFKEMTVLENLLIGGHILSRLRLRERLGCFRTFPCFATEGKPICRDAFWGRTADVGPWKGADDLTLAAP